MRASTTALALAAALNGCAGHPVVGPDAADADASMVDVIGADRVGDSSVDVASDRSTHPDATDVPVLPDVVTDVPRIDAPVDAPADGVTNDDGSDAGSFDAFDATTLDSGDPDVTIADGGSDAGPTTDTGPTDAGVTDAGWPAGALVAVSMDSQVGVLLEDFPLAVRDRVAADLVARPTAFWIERARLQLRMTALKTVYRHWYYREALNKWSLPLPPEDLWDITFTGPATRTTVDGHDMVAVSYTYRSTLLTDIGSPAYSEPALGPIGGVWDEDFTFPVDPTHIFQRTGYACMDEDEFPPESVDEENAYEYFDDTCTVERLGAQYCHHTLPLPSESCVNAIRRSIGHVRTALHFERLAWDPAVADSVRRGPLTMRDNPDLSVVVTGFQSLSNNRIVYRYIPADHCAAIEGCVAAPGWRRLVMFDSYDHNQGGAPLHIGPIDYAVSGLGSELISHNVYEYSACHNHYHFEYYGDFYFGSTTGPADVNKNGFCLESTGRLSNNEYSPTHTPYSCDNQGVSPGWGDLYAAGLTCNWVDVTAVDTTAAPVTQDLTFHSNPDGFLCEGTLLHDAMGNQIWEPTSFTTASGAPVDRPACTQAPGSEVNDLGQVPVTLPRRGGMVSSPCTSEQTMGPLRNCGFTMQVSMPTCAPGATVTLRCTGGTPLQPQAVRVCETSRVLGSGVDCVHRDALANTVVDGSATTTISFTCPAARAADEPGGQYAIYTAPVVDGDASTPVICAP